MRDRSKFENARVTAVPVPTRYSHRVLISSRAFCAVGLLFVVAGCQPASPKVTEKEKKEATVEEQASEKQAAKQPKKSEPAREPASDKPRNATPLKGVPDPANTCGHAIAFVAWRTGIEVDSDRLLFVDPGDNLSEVGRNEHRWEADPRESLVHFGRRRPTIVLDPAGAFTVCGAVVMAPKGSATPDEPIEAIANVIPDLSQALGDAWPGLCGPTSAADLIYAIGSRRKDLLAGLERGPSPQADRMASRLIVGLDNQVDEKSLAFRMGMAKEGKGVTNEGMQRGLSSWLADHDSDSWEVRLEWLDDNEKESDALANFFQKLERITGSGGGVILCLWPGSEFADGSTAERSENDAAAAAAALPTGRNSQGGSGGVGVASAKTGKPGTGKSSPPEDQSGQPSVDSQAGQRVDGPGGVPAGADADASSENTGVPSMLPGSDDSASGETASDAQASSTSPNPEKRRGFAGRKADPKAAAAALERALEAIGRAKKAEKSGDSTAAGRALGAAISALRPHAASNSDCRKALADATALAKALGDDQSEQVPAAASTTMFE